MENLRIILDILNSALRQAFIDWREDLEYQLSDEAVDDNIIANDYTFDECGNRF